MDVEGLVGLVRTASAEEEDPRSGLAAAARLRRECEQLEAVQVRRARTAGLTWEEISTALGVSRQAVHKKHGGRRLPGHR